jgi:hypothetical protein
MPALKPDQIEALSHLPAVNAIITELSELLQTFKKLEQSEIEFSASQYRKYKKDVRELEREKVVAVKEAHANGLAEGRAETKLLTSFLKYASHRRQSPSHVIGENQAVEDVLIAIYHGGDSGAAVAQKLAAGTDEVVPDSQLRPDSDSFTCNPFNCISNIQMAESKTLSSHLKILLQKLRIRQLNISMARLFMWNTALDIPTATASRDTKSH